MFSFRACFWMSDVYINGKYKYAANEILTAYLNANDLYEDMDTDELGHSETPGNLLYDLNSLKRKLILSDEMDFEEYTRYSDYVYAAIRIFTKLNALLEKLPPYNQIIHFPIKTLDDLLNEQTLFFYDGRDPNDDSPITWDTITSVGFGDQMDNGNFFIRRTSFIPDDPEHMKEYDADMLQSLLEFNNDMIAFFDGYIDFLKSYIAVHTVFKPFVAEYLHRNNSFPSANDVAQCFEEFNKSEGQCFRKTICQMQSFGYKVLKDERRQSILCEEISFTDLQSFLFFDLFNGIKHNYLPNQCKQCGRFFLIRGGKYYSYCDNPLPDDPDKTCRDVGARKRYDDKCKTDPVWQTYNRAYKAHYARYMKKKMTVSEFEEWSRFASELRDKAIAEEIPFEQYYAAIRK
jgi:hypothetical protein